MSSKRFAVAAIQPTNTSLFPGPLLAQLWQKNLHPLKATLQSQYGVHLWGLQLEHTTNTYPHRDFERIVFDLGLSPPLNRELRFLISDGAITKLPTCPANQLLIAIELSKGPSRWSAHPLDPKIARITCSFEELADILSDIILDFSFANSFVVGKTIDAILRSGVTMEQMYASKSTSAELNQTLPYYSFSYHERQQRGFGTGRHLQGFVSRWDSFLVQYLNQIPDTKLLLLETAKRVPGFKSQLSPRALGEAIKQVPAGAHLLYIQRRSSFPRASQKFRNELKAAADDLSIRCGRKTPFGFFINSAISRHAQSVIRKGSASVFRVYVGRQS